MTETAKLPRSDDGHLSKGEATRRRVVQHGVRLASRVGLQGLTIGDLASEMGLSKSGLFAHFKSKERLQLAVLDAASEEFVQNVFRPALQVRRGLPRLEALMEQWLAQSNSPELAGGCVLLASAIEWDDRPGPVRDAVVDRFQQLIENIERAVTICVQEGHLPAETDAKQLASELHAVVIKHHIDSRLLRNPRAAEFARATFRRLLSAHGARRQHLSPR